MHELIMRLVIIDLFCLNAFLNKIAHRQISLKSEKSKNLIVSGAVPSPLTVVAKFLPNLDMKQLAETMNNTNIHLSDTKKRYQIKPEKSRNFQELRMSLPMIFIQSEMSRSQQPLSALLGFQTKEL
jgi:hypothetical protein